jgi:hypothetical protein
MVDANNSRLARDVENRESAQRKQAWTPPQLLPSPKPQPGWTFRWIRISMMGQLDPTNASAKFREGWEPVKAADVPEIMHLADNSTNTRFKDNVEIGGLVLCKAPEEMTKQRNEYYANQAKAQVESVDNNFMRTEDKRMPLFNERRSTTTFGKGK